MRASHKERLMQLQASRDQSDKTVAAHMTERQSIARSHRTAADTPSAVGCAS